jgi:hypothetical protein
MVSLFRVRRERSETTDLKPPEEPVLSEVEGFRDAFFD